MKKTVLLRKNLREVGWKEKEENQMKRDKEKNRMRKEKHF
jgi:hypothetical protein